MSELEEAIEIQENSLRPVIDAATLLYRVYAPQFRRSMSPQPVFVTIPRGRSKGTRAWFWADQWVDRDGNRVPEINICPERLTDDLFDFANSVIHEMVHYSNHLDGIKDCSAQQYHNRRFYTRCWEVGLICEKHPQAKKYGWGSTRLGPTLKALTAGLGIDESIFRLCRVSATTTKKAGATRLNRWTCGCTIARVAGNNFQAVCTNCNNVFIRV